MGHGNGNGMSSMAQMDNHDLCVLLLDRFGCKSAESRGPGVVISGYSIGAWPSWNWYACLEKEVTQGYKGH